VVIYCRGGTAREERATVDQLRTVATKQGWTVVKDFVDRPEAGRAQWVALSQLLATSEADLLIVPSFAAIADTVSDVLEEIVRLRDAGCDLYVHDTELDTTSPIDRVLFRIADGLRSVERAGAKRPAANRARQARTKKLEPTPYQRSVIRGAIASGMKPREVAKLLKVPISLVQALAKGE
jgi:DNA invertase Pin-like site-specific DNA recombinase